MEPNSRLLIALLLLAAVAALWAVARSRLRTVKVVSALLALSLGVISGMAVVNDFYGYYRSWSAMNADLTDNYAAFTAASKSADAHRAATGKQPASDGRLVAMMLAGKLSGIRREGLVYLPPQYHQARYRDYRFPVLELLHGSPGGPSAWVVHLDVVKIENTLIAQHLMGPVVVVMPDFNNGDDYEECVNGPRIKDDTYISADVPSDIEAHFRVARSRSQWGIAGYSAGGYCAANLSLRHRGDYGAVGIMDGYFRPGDGNADQALDGNRAAEAQNDPLAAAQRLRSGSAPLPPYWLSAGSGVASDLKGAQAFASALRRVDTVSLSVEPGAGHNFYAWAPAVPRVLSWMWTQLAGPQLRADFPTRTGTVATHVLNGGRAPKGFYSRSKQIYAERAARLRAECTALAHQGPVPRAAPGTATASRAGAGGSAPAR